MEIDSQLQRKTKIESESQNRRTKIEPSSQDQRTKRSEQRRSKTEPESQQRRSKMESRGTTKKIKELNTVTSTADFFRKGQICLQRSRHRICSHVWLFARRCRPIPYRQLARFDATLNVIARPVKKIVRYRATRLTE